MLYAHRPIARRLLSTALPLKTALGELRVVRAEGLMAPIAAEGGVAGVAGIVAEAPIPEELARVRNDLGGTTDAWTLAITSRTSPPTSR